MNAIGIDLEVVPYAEARIDPLDLGLHRGYGIFDYFPLRDGMPWFLDDYLLRFRQSAKSLGLHAGIDGAALVRHLEVLAKANDVEYGGIKLLLTGGASEDGYTPRQPTLYSYAFAKTRPAEEVPTAGPPIRVNLLAYARQWPGVKTTNYLAALTIEAHQRASGASEVVYHRDGYVSEASRANFFLVTARGDLWVPPVEVALKGVTRHHTIQAARKAGITVLERSMPLSAIDDAAEAFVTGSSRGVQAVGQVEEHVIGDGGIGPVTQRVADLYAERGIARAGWGRV